MIPRPMALAATIVKAIARVHAGAFARVTGACAGAGRDARRWRPPATSVLIAALPDATDALPDATMAESANPQRDMPRDTPGEVAAPLSPGTQRGVLAIFGAGDILPLAGGHASGGRDDAVALVAETARCIARRRARQVVCWRWPTSKDSTPRHWRRGSCSRPMRCVGWIGWPSRQSVEPEALVAHLVGALGVERERVAAALAQGAAARDTASEASDLIGILSATESMTPAQRSYWSALLSSSV